MAHIVAESDIVEFEGFEDVVDRVLLRKATSFLEELQAELAPTTPAFRSPSMFSTKLRHGLEFRHAEVTVWAGYNGHRKSMFTSQVSLDLLAQGQRVMLASFEMEPVKTLARMCRQAWGTKTPTAAQIQVFANWTNGKLWIFDHIGRIQPSKVLAMSRYFQDEMMGHHVVIDSMMMVCRSEESLDEQKQFTTDLVRMVQETKLHAHLVAHCRKPQSGKEDTPPSKYDLRGSAAISDQAHNVVTIWANKAKKAKLESGVCSSDTLAEPDALVSMEKQRNGQWEGRCKLWFDESSLRFCDDGVSAVEPYAKLVSAWEGISTHAGLAHATPAPARDLSAAHA